MRPQSIPDSYVWEGAARQVIMPPEDEAISSTVSPVEVVVDEDQYGPRVCVLIGLERGDIELLADNGKFWLVMYGTSVPVFALSQMSEV